MTSNYAPDHDPLLDIGEDLVDEVLETDDSDDFRENLPEEIKADETAIIDEEEIPAFDEM